MRAESWPCLMDAWKWTSACALRFAASARLPKAACNPPDALPDSGGGGAIQLWQRHLEEVDAVFRVALLKVIRQQLQQLQQGRAPRVQRVPLAGERDGEIPCHGDGVRRTRDVQPKGVEWDWSAVDCGQTTSRIE